MKNKKPKLIDRMDSRVAKTEGAFSKISAKYPHLVKPLLSILSGIVFVGGVLFDRIVIPNVTQHREAQQNVAELIKTDREYKKIVADELERNIRVLQFYVWISSYPWKSDFQLTNTSKPYVDFTTSQAVTLQKVYKMAILGDILKIYHEFDAANDGIEQLNSMPGTFRNSRLKLQIADRLSATIKQAIPIHKKICDDINVKIDAQKKTYLSDEWSKQAILESNSLDFKQLEGRNIATAPQGALK